MTIKSLPTDRGYQRCPDLPIRTILDPRFPQPGRYSAYGVPEDLRPAADALYQALINCPEHSSDAQIIEAALLRLLEPWSRG
jgi:hypothetical protein